MAEATEQLTDRVNSLELTSDSLPVKSSTRTSARSSIPNASDFIFDYCCTVCEEDKLNSEASFYCYKCRKQFCDSCVRLHDKVHRDHAVLDRKCVQNWGQVKCVGYTELCSQHEGKEIEVFCEDHQTVCCSICVSVDHR